MFPKGTLKLPPPFLGVNRIVGTAGLINPEDRVYVNILETEGGRPNSAGIVVVSTLPDMVAPFEEHTARRKAGYTLPEWRSLDWTDRAIEVAMLRIEEKIDAIVSEEHEAEMKQKSKARPKGN